jgi:hypothetical protein
MFYCVFMVITLSFNMIQDTAQVRGHNLTYTVNTVADVFLYTSAMFSVRVSPRCRLDCPNIARCLTGNHANADDRPCWFRS